MLTTSVERLEGSAVKLTVTIPSQQVDEAVDAAYKKVANKFRIPGFRPGKAPKPILDQHVGREAIMAEATEELVNKTYPQALDAENLRPIEPPEMEDLDTVVRGEDYTYEAQIDVRPELTLSDTSSFAITLPPQAVSDEDIQEQIDMLRERFATLEPVEDRGVEDGDYVLLSFVGKVDGEDYEGNVVDKYLYEVGQGLMPAEFDQGIIGAKPGEERHSEFAIPDTSSKAEFVGKTATFDITIHEVKAKLMPPADDELAENVGFDSLQAMQDNMRERMTVQKAHSWQQLRERSARELLASRLEGDVPESMLVSRQQQMERDFMNMLEQREMSLEQYLMSTGVDFGTFRSDIEKQAVQSVREELALEALFREKGLEVTEEDINAEIAEVSSASNTPVEETRKRWEDLGLMSAVREQVMHRNAILWLLDNLEVTEETAETSATDEPAEGTKKAAPKKRASRSKKKAEEAEASDADKTEE